MQNAILRHRGATAVGTAQKRADLEQIHELRTVSTSDGEYPVVTTVRDLENNGQEFALYRLELESSPQGTRRDLPVSASDPLGSAEARISLRKVFSHRLENSPDNHQTFYYPQLTEDGRFFIVKKNDIPRKESSVLILDAQTGALVTQLNSFDRWTYQGGNRFSLIRGKDLEIHEIKPSGTSLIASIPRPEIKGISYHAYQAHSNRIIALGLPGLFSLSPSFPLFIIDASTGKTLRELQVKISDTITTDAPQFFFSHSGRYLNFLNGYRNGLRRIDLETGKFEISPFKETGTTYAGAVSQVEFLEASSVYVISADKGKLLYDWSSGQSSPLSLLPEEASEQMHYQFQQLSPVLSVHRERSSRAIHDPHSNLVLTETQYTEGDMSRIRIDLWSPGN